MRNTEIFFSKTVGHVFIVDSKALYLAQGANITACRYDFEDKNSRPVKVNRKGNNEPFNVYFLLQVYIY